MLFERIAADDPNATQFLYSRLRPLYRRCITRLGHWDGEELYNGLIFLLVLKVKANQILDRMTIAQIERHRARERWKALFADKGGIEGSEWEYSVAVFIYRYLRMRNSCDVLAKWISDQK